MYNLSTDYERLYTLLCEGEEVACYIRTGWKNISGKEITSIALARRDAEMLEINICHAIETVVCMDGAEKFTAECTRLNLSYIPPSRDTAEKAWDAGCTKLLADISVRFKENVKNADTIQDMAVFQAIADAIQKFPIPSKTDYLNSL